MGNCNGGTVRLSIHDIDIEIFSSSPTVQDQLSHDFSIFETDRFCPEKAFTLYFRKASERPKDWIPCFVGPKSVLYFSDRRKRVRFFKTSWVEYDFQGQYAEVFCDDDEIAYEVGHMILHSYLGESLDRRGWHRLHGMAFAKDNEGTVVLGKSGSGKSTLAMQLILKTRLNLLADDTPLISKDGKMHAFAERIALKERPTIEPKYVRRYERIQYGEKFIVGSRFFAGRVQPSADVQNLILISPRRKKGADLHAAYRWQMFWPLLKWLVVGHETPQIWELFLRTHDLKEKFKILISRIQTAWVLLFKCKMYRFHVSHDREKTSKAFLSFAEAPA